MAQFSGAAALEIYRNGTPYQVNIDLPYGADFVSSKVDRKFEVKGIQGNLRLIQDEYASCGPLIEERVVNKAKEGFGEIVNTRTSVKDCAVKLFNPGTQQTTSSNYIYLETCRCFVSLQLTSDAKSEPLRKKIIQGLLDQLRANNKPDGLWSADKEQQEYLTCDQKRAKGITVSENEYDMCGSGTKKKTATAKAAGDTQEGLKQKLRRMLEERDRENEQTLESQRGALQAGQDVINAADKQKWERWAAEWRKLENQSFVQIINLDAHNVNLVFHSQVKSRRWNGNRLSQGGEYRSRLNCTKGEKICMGAWRTNGDNTTWGVGPNNKKSCTNCCFVCGHAYGTHLSAAGEVQARPITNEALNSFLTGLNIGINAYNAYQHRGGGSGGGTKSCGGSCSGISGGTP